MLEVKARTCNFQECDICLIRLNPHHHLQGRVVYLMWPTQPESPLNTSEVESLKKGIFSLVGRPLLTPAHASLLYTLSYQLESLNFLLCLTILRWHLEGPMWIKASTVGDPTIAFLQTDITLICFSTYLDRSKIQGLMFCKIIVSVTKMSGHRRWIEQN